MNWDSKLWKFWIGVAVGIVGTLIIEGIIIDLFIYDFLGI